MSVACYVAFQAVGEGLLASVFFSAVDSARRPALERAVLAVVRPAWSLAREARGKRRSECGAVAVTGVEGEGRTAVWLAQAGVCHAVVLERETGAELAANFLSVFAQVLGEHVKGGALETFLVKPDEGVILLEKFLPCGQLLVLQTNLIKHLKKEADSLIVQKVA